MCVHAKLPCNRYNMKFLTSDSIMLEAVLLKTPGWALISVNFGPMQEIGPQVGGKHSFMSGHSFMHHYVNSFHAEVS